MHSKKTFKRFVLRSVLALAMLLSSLPTEAIPESISKRFVKLQDQFGSSLALYVNQKDLSHDLSKGDFDLRLFFDGRSLLKEKVFPQNIKVEIFTMVDGQKSLLAILNRTVKHNKAARNVLLATRLPRIEQDTELLFNIYDTHNILAATYMEMVTVQNNDPSAIASLESTPDYDCSFGDGECLLDYIFDNVSISANYDRHLKTEVYKNDKGKYFINIPVKRGRHLGKKVHNFNLKDNTDGGGGIAGTPGQYPFFDGNGQSALLSWDEIAQAIVMNFSNGNTEFQFKEDGSVALNDIIFEQGDLSTSPVVGQVEFDGDDLYLTTESGRSVIGGSGPAGPVGPQGPQGPQGPAGPGVNGDFLSNGGTLNGVISFTNGSHLFNPQVNGALVIPAGAMNGYVLTTDNNGLTSWQSAAALSGMGDNLGNHTATDNLDLASHHILDADQVNGVTGNFTTAVGINLSGAPTAALHVNGYGLIGDPDNYITAIGIDAAVSNTGTNGVFLGRNAGRHNEGDDIVGLGHNVLRFNNGDNVIAFSRGAGYFNNGDHAILIGRAAGYENEGNNTIALGYYAARENKGVSAIAIGESSAYYNNGKSAIAIGRETLHKSNGDFNIAIGDLTASDLNNGSENIFIGHNIEAQDNNGSYELNIGDTIYGDLANGEIALGAATNNPEATLDLTGSFRYIDGNEANNYVLTSNGGGFATWQSLQSVVNGTDTGSDGIAGAVQFSDGNNGFDSDATNLFWNNTSDRLGINVAAPQLDLHVNGSAIIGNYNDRTTIIGRDAGTYNTGTYTNLVGSFAGRNNIGNDVSAFGKDVAAANQGDSLSAFGVENAFFNNGDNVVSIGTLTAYYNNGDAVIAIGASAARENNGDYVTAIGPSAAFYNSGDYSNILGFLAGTNQSGNNVTLLGNYAGRYNQGNNVIALGNYAAHYMTGKDNIAIGVQTLNGSDGDYNVAIGYDAGRILNNGAENILIGHNVEAPDNNGDYQLNIGNTIYGDLNNGEIALGIADDDPQATLELNGSFLYRDGNQANGFVLTSNGGGIATWQSLQSIINGADTGSDGAAGAIQFSDGANGFDSDATNLFYNDATNRLGIGTDGPAAILQVNGSALMGYPNLSTTAIGLNAADSNTGTDVVAIGGYTARNNLGTYVHAIGYGAANANDGNQVQTMGLNSAFYNNGDSVNAFGRNAAEQNNGDYVNAIGYYAAQMNTENGVNAIGYNAARDNTGIYINAIGFGTARYNNGDYLNAIGYATATANNGDHVTAIGHTSAQYNNGNYLASIGLEAAQFNNGSSVNAFGYRAGRQNEGNSNNFLGNSAGYSNNGTYVNALGLNTAYHNIGDHVNAFGDTVAHSNNGDNLNAFGEHTAQNNTGNGVNAFGYFTAQNNTGNEVNAMGASAAGDNKGFAINAFGNQTARYNSGNHVNAFGNLAAQYNSGNGVVAIGRQALNINNGNFNIAIGYEAATLLNNGSESIFIGHGVEAIDNNGSYELNIGNTIYGDLNNGEIALGKATSDPQATLEINGDMLLGDSSQSCAAGTAGLMRFNGSSSLMEYCNGITWNSMNATSASGDYILLADQRASGTAGGTCTASSWVTRNLNTIITDQTGSVSVATNQATLPAGDYECEISGNFYETDNSQLRLYNVTDAAVIAYGMSTYNESPVNALSTLKTRFTLAASKTVRVEGYCSTSNGANDFGRAVSTGANETHTYIRCKHF